MSSSPPHTSVVDQRTQRRVLRRLGLLLDLNNDLARNASDTRFSGRSAPSIDFEGENYYVFDTDIFELFIQPLEHASYCANFYGDDWGHEGKSRLYSAQAGLIAAEYLFSGDLPGLARDGPIYMTEWHYSELKKRLYSLRGVLSRRAKQALETDQKVENYLEEFERHVHLGGGDSPTDELDRALELAAPETRADALRFLKLAPEPRAVLRFVTARELAPRLVQDVVIEPLEQLNRVYSEILSRVRPLSIRFAPEEKDRAELVRLIEDWQLDLERLHRDKSRPGRIKFDAKSVAYVHWVARRQLNRHERIMLVTGDNALYQAYSLWHQDRPTGEAFLLRRVNQYSPLINPHDTPNDIRAGDEGGYQLFDSTRRAMDAPLVSFNLRWEQGRARAHLANLLRTSKAPELDPAIALFDLSPDWWLERDQTFEDLRNQWREAERIGIGASLPVLERRLDRRRSFLASVGGAADASKAFTHYLSLLLDEIAQRGIRAEFPEAVRFVTDRPSYRARSLPRAPLDVSLKIPVPDKAGGWVEYDLSEIIDRWLNDDDAINALLDPDKNSALFDRLDIVYGVAAALAIRSELWTDADRFAENSITASENTGAAGGKSFNETRLECLYLSALAKRFVIASTSPETSLAKEDIWRENLEHALASLNQVEKGYRALGQERHVFRAISERVAVRLFHASWKAVVKPDILSQSGFDPNLPVRHYHAAMNDIRQGWASLDLARRKEQIAGPHPLNVNAAAFAVVRELLAKRGEELPSLSPSELARIEGELQEVLPVLETLPPIVAVDVYAFLWMVRGHASARQPLESALRMGKFHVLLDSALAGALRAELRTKSGGDSVRT